jgi:cobalamin biosynthesis protein CobW
MIVNDFGKVNVDAALVEKQVDELVSLSNGCLCCSLSNELDDSLSQLTDSNKDLDFILVEASGLADPMQMVELVLNSKSKKVYFQDIIYLIDAVNFTDLWRNETYRANQGLRIAKIVLVNKVDLSNPDQIAQIEAIVREVNPRALIVPTSQAQFDYRLLVDQKTTSHQLKIGQTNHHNHKSYGNYTSFDFHETRPLDPLKTTTFLNNLPNNIYRAKGWMNFGKKAKGHKILLQLVGRQHQLKAVPLKDNEKLLTELVFVGVNINEEDLLNKLRQLIDEDPGNVTNENRVSVEYFR